MCWSKLSDECFEHYQRTIADIQRHHTLNQAAGAQICSNIQYAWQSCVPDVAALRAAGEEKAEENFFLMKKYSSGSSQG